MGQNVPPKAKIELLRSQFTPALLQSHPGMLDHLLCVIAAKSTHAEIKTLLVACGLDVTWPRPK